MAKFRGSREQIHCTSKLCTVSSIVILAKILLFHNQFLLDENPKQV